MSTLRLLTIAASAALTLAAATLPAGSSVSVATDCGPTVVIRDPVLRASFAHFERNQTSVATRLCAAYRNATP